MGTGGAGSRACSGGLPPMNAHPMNAHSTRLGGRWWWARRAATRSIHRSAPPTHRPVLLADLTGLVVGSMLMMKPVVAVAFIGVAMLVLAAGGAYRQKIIPQLAPELPALVGRLAVAAVIVAVFFSRSAEGFEVVQAIPLVVVAVVAGRAVMYAGLRHRQLRITVQEPTLVIGAGEVGASLAERMLDHPEYGLVPIGFLDSCRDVRVPLPILGEVHELDRVLDQHRVGRVIVAFGATGTADMVKILRACEQADVDVHVVPRFFELCVGRGRGDLEELWGIPLWHLKRASLPGKAWRAKRAFDLALSVPALVLMAPVLAVVALAVRLSSPGPILFRQPRVGQRERVFDLLKFRTLPVNNDDNAHWSTSNDDDRLTSVGRIIRRFSIDELPQLINVAKGDMSLVGPRPERPYFVEQFRLSVPGYSDRLRMPVGLTGWAQVNGLRGNTSIADRALFDNRYIEHWSLWTDVVIILRTLLAVLREPRPAPHPSPPRAQPQEEAAQPAPGEPGPEPVTQRPPPEWATATGHP